MYFKPLIALLICCLFVKPVTAQYNAYKEEETTIPAAEFGINGGIFSVANQPSRPYARMQGVALVADAIQVAPTLGYWFGNSLHLGLYVNVPMSIGRSYIYLGPHGGTLFGSGTGFSYGVQLGANIRISERVYFNTEGSLMLFSQSARQNTIRPILGGLRFRID